MVIGKKRESHRISESFNVKRLRNLADLENAAQELCFVDPRFLAIIEKHGVPSLRSSPQGLEGLLMIVTEQFLSLQAAAAIWARVRNRLKVFDAQNVLSISPEELLSLGLSRAKTRTFHEAARHELDGTLDFASFEALDEKAIAIQLCKLTGVGPWTSDIFLLSVLGAGDAWPAGDLALRVSIQNFLKLNSVPEINQMAALAQNWRPYRAVAARLLWSHYRDLKGLKQA